MPLHPGDQLFHGQYRIMRQIGRGGFGFVYVAQHALLGQEVAIKELIPGLVGDDAMLKRFLAEARATLRLSHDRIVRTHEVFSERENYYIAMEYMAGGSLEARLAAGALPVEEAVHVAQEVAEGLGYAHEHGVVHCDLKPANILFSADGLAKVADFGIAHVSDRMLSRTWQTPSGFTAGTLPYMAPEQVEGVRDDPRVDVYALGAVLYRALTGRTYLDFDTRETPGAQARNVLRIQQEPVQAPSTLNRRVPDWLDQVVLMALAKNPDERFGSAGALLNALRSAGVRPGVAAPPPAAVGVPGPRTAGRAGAGAGLGRPARLSGLRLGLAAGGAVLALAVLVALAWLRFAPPSGSAAAPVKSALSGASSSPGVEFSGSTATLQSSTRPPTAEASPSPAASPTNRPTTAATLMPSPSPAATPAPTATLPAGPAPTAAPTAIPPQAAPVKPTCSIAVQGEFSALRNNNWQVLGCPVDGGGIVTPACEQAFQGGHLFWRSDTTQVYMVFDRNKANGADLTSGDWFIGPREWGWDGSDPQGIGLQPPPGLYEPIGGLGWLWRKHLGGADGRLGWAVAKEYCFEQLAVAQTFQRGIAYKSSDPKVYALLSSKRFVSQR